ncbi:MAG: N-acetylmannosamine-6-phosphate 2-epimerase [Acholeplasmatales bacterium]|nr:MAG: N-acetylmannosamine-6-phosphate 2-epimerase [Acholeplasmatales bacterium]
MLDTIKGGLIVSCQALPDEPLHSPMIMAKMALAAKVGGAVAIRANTVADILAIQKEVDLPIIGLIKRDFASSSIYITPTAEEVHALLDTGCDMIAVDATGRHRPNGDTLAELVDLIHAHGVLAMADIATHEEAMQAQTLGFDCVSTTLSGYTSYTKTREAPDYELIGKLVRELDIPVIAEGRIASPKQARKVMDLNPHAIVVGTAITRPQVITRSFYEALNKP